MKNSHPAVVFSRFCFARGLTASQQAKLGVPRWAVVYAKANQPNPRSK